MNPAADWPLWRATTWPLTRDEVGPIARTVMDAALLLDVRAGYDAGGVPVSDRPVVEAMSSAGRIGRRHVDGFELDMTRIEAFVGLVVPPQFGPQLLLLRPRRALAASNRPWTGFAADHFNS
jgi:hypothetical protein